MPPIVYSVAEISEILKCDKHIVYKLIKAGLLSAMKLGQLKVSHDALMEFIAESQGKDLTDPFNPSELKGIES